MVHWKTYIEQRIEHLEAEITILKELVKQEVKADQPTKTETTNRSDSNKSKKQLREEQKREELRRAKLYYLSLPKPKKSGRDP